ncbi:hypothetical protein LZ30DRAFT_430727 [Colletotrichum cereale]|nr:hypothetical protein LZ30DRAFT_430727 [Colletotrichum cereale]
MSRSSADAKAHDLPPAPPCTRHCQDLSRKQRHSPIRLVSLPPPPRRGGQRRRGEGGERDREQMPGRHGRGAISTHKPVPSKGPADVNRDSVMMELNVPSRLSLPLPLSLPLSLSQSNHAYWSGTPSKTLETGLPCPALPCLARVTSTHLCQRRRTGSGAKRHFLRALPHKAKNRNTKRKKKARNCSAVTALGDAAAKMNLWPDVRVCKISVDLCSMTLLPSPSPARADWLPGGPPLASPSNGARADDYSTVLPLPRNPPSEPMSVAHAPDVLLTLCPPPPPPKARDIRLVSHRSGPRRNEGIGYPSKIPSLPLSLSAIALRMKLASPPCFSSLEQSDRVGRWPGCQASPANLHLE